MVLDDWSYCPHCEFPALYSQFELLVKKTGQCPMCNKEVAAESIVHVRDPVELLKGPKNDEGIDEAGYVIKRVSGKENNTGLAKAVYA